MSEWTLVVPTGLVSELEDCIAKGPIIDDFGKRLFEEELFDRINGLKIELFSKEHPPPHFRVCFQNECNNFSIKDCTPLNGKTLSRYFRNIKKWHNKNKDQLIDFWNKTRPTDCPVGLYKE